jgi:hypothetical protein
LKASFGGISLSHEDLEGKSMQDIDGDSSDLEESKGIKSNNYLISKNKKVKEK